uniref:Uncharacterized protein n=1 Tax=Neobodo designis TaxID=312471 RepID=A0A6U4UGN0_NEODS|eukprot:CAMPEP_0174832228 /NCGR_PEP_ID=MMETSP1114-20130205/3562_1 /TAXON_ID=312471 /ORGANISM="Neobodo designis, Strain CCAP 1951/1" /LENGTH=178 /DNA_ID=CAMNT_0016066083 /DNA_START=35 /DNA_END=571 /DNA_ORIENTATION=+
MALIKIVAALALAVGVAQAGFPLGLSASFLNYDNPPTSVVSVAPGTAIIANQSVTLPANFGFDLLVFGSFASTTNVVRVDASIPSTGQAWSGNFVLRAGEWTRTISGLGGWNDSAWQVSISVPSGAPGSWYIAGGPIPNGTHCCAEGQCYCSMDSGIIAQIVPATAIEGVEMPRRRRH